MHLPKAPNSRMTMLQEGADAAHLGKGEPKTLQGRRAPQCPAWRRWRRGGWGEAAASDIWDPGGVRIMFLKGQFCTWSYHKLAFLRKVPTAVLREIWGPEQAALVFTLTNIHLRTQPALAELLDGVGAASSHSGYKYESNWLCMLKIGYKFLYIHLFFFFKFRGKK